MIFRRMGWAVAGIIAVGAGALQAQTPAPGTLQTMMFTSGFRDDHVAYYTAPGTDVVPRLFLDVLYDTNDTIAALQPVFGANSGQVDVVPFQMVVEFTVEQGAINAVTGTQVLADALYATRGQVGLRVDRQLAPAAPLEASVCYVRIFSNFATNPRANAMADIAHELSHCYQSYYITVNIGERPRRWWVEGGANWLAYSLVYPTQPPPQSASSFDYSQDILERSYDNYYFWDFLGSPLGLGDPQLAVDFMMSMPDDVGEFPAALERAHPSYGATELFHRWALALEAGTLPHPPPNINLSTLSPISARNSSGTSIGLVRFSAGYRRITDFRVEPGNRAYIQVNNTSANNYQASVRIGGTVYPLGSDAPHVFCPPADGALLILSRGNGAPGDSSRVSVTWGQVPSDAPCEQTPETPEAALCPIGNWVTTAIPSELTMLAREVGSTLEFTVTFSADGTYSGVNSAGGGRLEQYLPFEGDITFTAVEGSPNEYTADGTFFYYVNREGAFQRLNEPDGSAGMFVEDMAGYMARNNSFNTGQPPTNIVCEGDVMSFTDRSGGINLNYVWARVDD